MRIETERLYLREMTAADYEALYAVLADSDIMQHYPYTFDEARVRGWIDRNIERYSVFGFGLWAVCLHENGEMIGDCGLTMQLINGQIKPEIGCHIRRDMQRRGYAKESASAVRDWAFCNTPFNAVYSYMKAANLPSCRTAESWADFRACQARLLNPIQFFRDMRKNLWGRMLPSRTLQGIPRPTRAGSFHEEELNRLRFLPRHRIRYNNAPECQAPGV